jgi:type II secretory pathway component PulF
MPRYIYVAKTKDGKTLREKEEAFSKEELISRLRARGLFIVEVQEVKVGVASKKTKVTIKFKAGKRYSVKISDLTFLARNLSTTLSSGVTLLRSLEIISLQTTSLQLAKALGECGNYVKEGLSLSEAIGKYPKIFSHLWRGIVEVGEASGNLPLVLDRLADYLERRMEFERKLKSALVYPSIIIVAAILAMFIFFQFILPKFAEVFDQFNIDLPLLTQILFDISKIFQKFWYFIIGGIIALAVFFFRSQKDPQLKKVWDKIYLQIPLIKDLVFLSCLERFNSTMHILLESGLPLVSTLEIAGHAVGNSLIEKSIIYIKDRVKEGHSLSAEFTKQALFPPLISEMSKIGEETGTLPQVFEKVSVFYQKDLTSKLERFIAAFEPLMILSLGVAIGILVISLFLPLFKLSTLSGGSV